MRSSIEPAAETRLHGMKRLRSATVAVLATTLLFAAAGCGGSEQPSATSTAAAAVPSPLAAMKAYAAKHPEFSGTATVLFQGSAWSVVQAQSASGAHAIAFHLIGGTWHPDLAGVVKITILGPQPGQLVAAIPQVAFGIKAPVAFVESGMWVDGTELFEKGGGSPTEGTIYGAPAKKLKPGTHVAVGYARTNSTATAVAWLFRTR